MSKPGDIMSIKGHIWISLGTCDDGSVVIVNTYKDSPAEKAGMKVGDVVLSIDGVDITGKGEGLLSSLSNGEDGTHVTFTVLRDGNKIDLDVTRGKVVLPSVSFTIEDGIATIWISTFNHNTEEEFMDCLRKVEENHVSGIVLDLLDNTGGYVESIAPIASCFLDEGAGAFTVAPI